jgi:hypothetical protein
VIVDHLATVSHAAVGVYEMGCPWIGNSGEGAAVTVTWADVVTVVSTLNGAE